MKSVLPGICLMLTLCPLQAAQILSISPAAQTVSAGQTLSVNVLLGGIVSGTSNVGAFDLHLDFSATVLTPTGVSFGPSLGNPSLLEAFASSTLLPGEVQFAEASLLTPAMLAAMQGSSVTLATIGFRATGSGSTMLTFTQTVVDDPLGNKLTITSVPASVTAVPEPSGIELAALAAWVFICKRRDVSRQAGGLSS